MGIELADLIESLEADAPAQDGIPSSDQYERAIKDAVADFSRRCGTEKISYLTIVSGTAAYSFPDDFLKLILIETPMSPDGVLINSESKLVPVSAEFQELYTIRGKTITFYPTPSYSMRKDYRYKAGWVLNDDGDEYEELTEEEAEIILIKARSQCLTKQANSISPDAIDYQQGDVKVSIGTTTLSLRADAEAAQKEYEQRCDSYNGPYGVLA